MLIGKVLLKDHASWFGGVIRGHNALNTLGESTNVQEGAVLHPDAGFGVEAGNRVAARHQAMLSGCTVGGGSLIGVQAFILNGATIGGNRLVSAGAVVTEGTRSPDRSLLVHTRAKVVARTSSAARPTGAKCIGYAERQAVYRCRVERIG